MFYQGHWGSLDILSKARALLVSATPWSKKSPKEALQTSLVSLQFRTRGWPKPGYLTPKQIGAPLWT